MYIYTPLCRYWIALYRYVLVFIVPHVDIELEDNKQFISNNPCKHQWIFTKLGMCIDIMEIWFGIANGQILSNFYGVICPQHDNGRVL